MDCSMFSTPPNNQSIIWLDQDFTSLFHKEYWFKPSFAIGITIISVIVIILSFVITYYNYPRNKLYFKQKQIKLLHVRSLGLIIKDDIMPHLNKYTRGNIDVNNLILQFADTKVFDNVDSIIKSVTVTNQTSLLYLLCICIISATFLIVSYIPLHMVATHWSQSYVSYLKTECQSEFVRSGAGDDEEDLYHTQVVIDKLCNDNTLTYGKIQYEFLVQSWELTDHLESGDLSCYVHKDNGTVRIPIKGCNCCTRCGKGCTRCYKSNAVVNCCDCCNCCSCCNGC
eukprot:523601_1